MEYGLLGPLEVRRDGAPVDVGSPKQRALLCILLVHANQVVSTDRLIDGLWDGAAPAQATVTLQSYVSNLRRVLEPDRPSGAAPTVLVTRSPGYLLQVAPGELDTDRFAVLVQEGRDRLAADDPSGAMEAFARALGLWRGDPLADVAFETFAQGEVARLTELRLAAEEERGDAALALGQHAAAVADLERLVAAHPLRERLRGQLMLALYRSGRQADALRAYRDGRNALVEELGIEPGPALQRLEEAILLQEPSLDWRPTAAPPPPPAPVPPPTREPAPATTGPALVGRDPEMGLLADALIAASSGLGRLVLIGGEPGIGKTRLTEELAARAHERGTAVRWGHCPAGQAAPPFWPWVQVLRDVADDLDDDALARAAGSSAAELAKLVPDIAARLGAPGDEVDFTGEAGRFRLYDAISRFLVRVAAGQRQVIVIDDLQWADSPSLRLLDFLAGDLRDAGLLVVAAYRDTEVGAGHALADVLGDISRHPTVARIDLGGLREGDVGRIVADTVGATPPPHVAATLHARTGGNPFYVTELARLLTSEGVLAGAADAPIPASVRDVIHRRVRTLGEDAEPVLTVCSLGFTVVAGEIAAEMLDLPGDRVEAVLEAAVAARLMEQIPGGLGRHRWAHALFRETLYDALPPARRAELHAAAGTIAERMLGDRAHLRAPELAAQFCRGATAGTWQKGVEYARRCGEQAVVSLAYEDAVRYYAMALEALAAAPEPDDALRCQLLVEQVEAEILSGDVETGRQRSHEAFELARTLGDGNSMALMARCAAGRGLTWWSAVWRTDQQVVRMLEETLEVLGPDDSVRRVAALSHLAQALFFTDDPRRDDLADEAMQMARRLGDPRAISRALMAQYACRWDEGDPAARIEVADEQIEVTSRHRLGDGEALGRQMRVAALIEAGRIGEARAEVRRAHRAADEARVPSIAVELGWYDVAIALLVTDLEAAEELLDTNRRLARRMQAGRQSTVGAFQLAHLRRDQGRLVEAEGRIRDIVDRAPRVRGWRAALALLLAEDGRGDEAADLVRRLADDGFDDGAGSRVAVSSMVVAAEAAAAIGDAELAGHLRDLLAPHEGRLLVLGASQLVWGDAGHYLGRLAATVGDLDQAARLLTAALERHEHLGARGLATRSRLWLGATLMARGGAGDTDGAVGLLQQALTDAEHLGLPAVADDARRLLPAPARAAARAG